MQKLSSIVFLVFVAAGSWWLWTGPIRDMRTVTEAEQLQINADNMARCLAGLDYVANSTGEGTANPEERCAKRFNLYRHAGKWYSYAQVRAGPG